MISAVEREARAVGVTDWVDVVFDISKLVQRAVSHCNHSICRQELVLLNWLGH